MPRTYCARIPVPDHEIDAFEELRPSSYVRFLQRAAREASAEAGYNEDWYSQAGTIWVIRRTTIEYLSPARLGEVLEVETHVADFRRVRSRRDYGMREARSGRAIATARTDWVYLERATGKLCRVPPEMIAGFAPEGEVGTLPREPFRVPEAPASAFSAERRVELRDLDGMRHVNNAVYIDYLAEVFLDGLAARGFGLGRWLAEGGHLRPALHDVEYLQEARYGERLRCTTWRGEDPLERWSEIVRIDDGTRLTRARSRWLWIDRESGVPVAPPRSLAAALQ